MRTEQANDGRCECEWVCLCGIAYRMQMIWADNSSANIVEAYFFSIRNYSIEIIRLFRSDDISRWRSNQPAIPNSSTERWTRGKNNVNQVTKPTNNDCDCNNNATPANNCWRHFLRYCFSVRFSPIVFSIIGQIYCSSISISFCSLFSSSCKNPFWARAKNVEINQKHST